MFLPIVPAQDCSPSTASRNPISAISLRRVAEAQGVKVQADPEPLRNAFIRSDQYSFIRHGIPAVAMKVGYEQGSPERSSTKTGSLSAITRHRTT